MVFNISSVLGVILLKLIGRETYVSQSANTLTILNMGKARNRFGCAETLRLSRTNYWTAYLNKQKLDPNVDDNTRWDEYYRAKTLGIYKTSHLARIENRLNAYAVADVDEMELINRFFVHNTEKLASWRMLYIQMSELKKSALYDTLTSREERAAQNILMENMR